MDQTDDGGGGGFPGFLSDVVKQAGSVFTSAYQAQAAAQAAQATAALAASSNQQAAMSRDAQIKFAAIGVFAMVALFVLIRQTRAA